ncbi:torsin-like protein [Anopheles bellator]|uniref:torsin-like protein n=1 Tax=Anopheles bellator TaxID=139047 RepID=UPI002649846E|nr:torsin-like protein [Anopheles bellator]
MKLSVPLRALSWCILVNSLVPCSAFFDVGNVAEVMKTNLAAAYSYTKHNTYCKALECCSLDYIYYDLDALGQMLEKNLFGQHIARTVVVGAIGGHLKNIATSDKPLVISFHGAPGTGKNYIAEHVARALYKKGMESKFVHKYLGRIDFPLESRLEEYRVQLVNDITSAIAHCPQSLFIFDEVEKMPPGLFDSIVSLLDNHAYSRHHDYRQAIFIFLSNIGGPEIAEELKQLMKSGKWREDTKMHDFERTLEISAYNLDGGLLRSELIESHVIDHFIPFLPLEQRHVESCIKKEYFKLTGRWNIQEDFLNEIFKEAVTMDNEGLFSNNGCKRVSKKVEALYYNRLRKNPKEEL